MTASHIGSSFGGRTSPILFARTATAPYLPVSVAQGFSPADNLPFEQPASAAEGHTSGTKAQSSGRGAAFGRMLWAKRVR